MRVLVEVDLLGVLHSSIDAVLPNGSPLYQKVIYETLLKFYKNCKVLGHSTGACSKDQVGPQSVEKKGIEKEAAMSKGNVFSRLTPLVDVPTAHQPKPPVNAPIDSQHNPSVDVPTAPQLKPPVNAPINSQHNPSVDVPTCPQVSVNAREEQQCD